MSVLGVYDAQNGIVTRSNEDASKSAESQVALMRCQYIAAFTQEQFL